MEKWEEFKEWCASLETLEMTIYCRMNFLHDDFEYEQYYGQNILRNIFGTKQVDEKTETIFMSFPERWMNVHECRLMFDRIKTYYPNLRVLQVKTNSPLLIGELSREYCYLFTEEKEKIRLSKDDGDDSPTSFDDAYAVFKDISKGKLFAGSIPQTEI